ncbi:MAG: hypothetical protein M3P18_12390 [Actinomycetota bacterium]|nr:hypothetical protein [Actinomycetota bacterium]
MKKSERIVALVTAILALTTALIYFWPAVFHSGHATPTIDGAATSGTPTPSQAPSHVPVSQVYWQGAVGITFGPPGGINFDLKPATTSADSATNISFDGTALENFYVGTTMLISRWTGPGRPTQAQCANTVLTHPSNIVNNVAEGMLICTRTIQGRIGRLTVTSISQDHSTLNVMAVIWN